MKFTPLNNMALIELTEEYAGIARNDSDEQGKKGILRDYQLTRDHLTESGGYEIAADAIIEYRKMLDGMIGKTVEYQEHADSGRKRIIDGKKYVVIPWYRILGVYEDEERLYVTV